jgi:hypothetical protein
MNRGIYVFGGFARDVFADLKFYNLSLEKWFIVEQGTEEKGQKLPEARS